MTYSVQGIINPTDFNNFRTRIVNIYQVGFGDSGYGQSILPINAVTSNTDIKSLEWTQARNIIAILSQHQGGLPVDSSVPDTSTLAVGKKIQINTSSDFETAISKIETDKLLISQTSSITSGGLFNVSNVSPWNTQFTLKIDVQFVDDDNARYFFNSGGQLIFDLSRTGGTANAQNTALTSLLTSIGSIVFDHTQTTQLGTGGVVSNIGFYDITDIFQTIFTQADTGTLSVNVQAKRETGSFSNGGNGSLLNFQFIFNDSLSSETLDGTLKVDSGMRIAIDPLDIASPTFISGGTGTGGEPPPPPGGSNGVITAAGGTGTDIFSDIAIDNIGNIYACGTTNSFNTASEALLSKFDSSLSLIWSRNIQVTGNDIYEKIYIFNNNIYVIGVNNNIFSGVPDPFVGNTAGPFLLSKFDLNGNHIWSKIGPDTNGNSNPNGIVIDSAGNIIISASTDNPSSIKMGHIIKYDPSGNVIFNLLTDSAVTGNNGRASPTAINIDSVDNIYIVGITENSSTGANSSFFISKLDSTGNVIWAKATTLAIQSAVGVVVNKITNEIYVVGFSTTPNNGLLFKFDSLGNLIWQKIISSSSDIRLNSVILDSTQNIIVTGHTNSAGAGLNDGTIMKFDSSGNLIFANVYGGTSDDFLGSTVLGNSDILYSAGKTSSFGTGAFSGFLVNADSAGTVASCTIDLPFVPTISNNTAIIENFGLILSSFSTTVSSPGINSNTDIISVSALCGDTGPGLPPNWSTVSGSLGSVLESDSTTTFVVLAIDPNLDTVVYSVSPTSPALPGTYSIDSSTGIISGTAPFVASTTTFDFSIRASDGILFSDRQFSITVLNAGAPTWITSSGILGTFFDNSNISIQLDASPLPLTFSLVSGSFPSGISMDSLGLITGLLPSVGPSGQIFNFTIRASNGVDFADRAFGISIAQSPVLPVWSTLGGSLGSFSFTVFEFTTGGAQNLVVNDTITPDTINIQLVATSSLPLTYSIVSGSAPVPLSSSGLLFGSLGSEFTVQDSIVTASTPVVSNFTVRASDGTSFADRSFSISVSTPIVTPSIPGGI